MKKLNNFNAISHRLQLSRRWILISRVNVLHI